MYKITLLPQKGIRIKGIGQVNFGDTKDQLLKVFGDYETIPESTRICFKNYGFFADFKRTDGTFEAVEFWNDGNANVSQVFMYKQDVLAGNAQEILTLLKEKNGDEDAIEGWFYKVDVIYSGGNPKNELALIEQYKQDGTYEESKAFLAEYLEKAQHFSSFGIGYKGYCKESYDYIQSVINGTN
jgi:hypothetical protein